MSVRREKLAVAVAVCSFVLIVYLVLLGEIRGIIKSHQYGNLSHSAGTFPNSSAARLMRVVRMTSAGVWLVSAINLR